MRLAVALVTTILGGVLAADLARGQTALSVASPEVDRHRGAYVFSGTCDDECSTHSFALRIRRTGVADVFLDVDADETHRYFARYVVRCNGPRGISWRLEVDEGDGRAAGYFRMPKCGAWRPDVSARVAIAELDVIDGIRRKERMPEGQFPSEDFDVSCDRRGRGRFRCRAEYFVGDNHVYEKWSALYERRPGDEASRHSVRRLSQRTVSEYPG